jgi:hypothetical protein
MQSIYVNTMCIRDPQALLATTLPVILGPYFRNHGRNAFIGYDARIFRFALHGLCSIFMA